MSGGDEVRRVVVGDPLGLHARPCASLAALVRRHAPARLVVRHRGQQADGAHVIELLVLTVPGGAEVELVASGPGAGALADAAQRLLSAPAGPPGG